MKTIKKKLFKLKVNNKIYEIEIECPTGKEILNIAGYIDFDRYDLIVLYKGKDELVKLDDSVCLSDPGVERFRVRPRTVKDGFKEGESPLSIKDTKFLNRNYKDRWRFYSINNYNLLEIKDYQLPSGFTVERTNLYLIIPALYDSVQLDMAFFKTGLVKKNGTSMNRVTNRIIGNETFQQWSRHRNDNNPWIIGLDCVETHLNLVFHFLKEEAKK